MKRIVLALLLLVMSGCDSAAQNQPQTNQPLIETGQQLAAPKQALPFSFEVKPETFELFVESGGSRERASEPLPARRVEQLQKSEQEVSWSYPDDKLQVRIRQAADHLQITLTSTGTESFSWPLVKAPAYMLPLGEGKWIPAGDKVWQSFLREESLTFSESFSMRFFALNHEKYAIFYMVDNMFNNTLDFAVDPEISLRFTHEFPTINHDKSYSFRLYVTQNDPVQIAGLYKHIIQQQGEFATLAQKAAANPNVEKLYGAPHFYLWNKTFLSEDDVQWDALKKAAWRRLYGLARAAFGWQQGGRAGGHRATAGNSAAGLHRAVPAQGDSGRPQLRAALPRLLRSAVVRPRRRSKSESADPKRREAA
ncbi:hypothetical protein ACEF06_15710 [Brevibacillus agri]|uniref:hypothetical protein n=1 Tax=Brevibacillus agri TaxID=51101 RepID=UPI0021ADC58B|nr:hypothetical protein [Brevibacillus agri]